MAYPIPIQNIYFIFCYAWRRLEEGGAVDVGGVTSPELPDLFAKVLAGAIRHLMRRGIDRNYITLEQSLPTVRGRIRVRESISPLSRRQQQVACEFDEFSADILSNRLLKSTIARLCHTRGLDAQNAHELRALLRYFRDVSEVRLRKRDFRQVRVHRNNSFYSFLLSVCELIFDATLPEPDGRSYRFSDILRDEQKMALVFQSFVRNFYSLEQHDFRVTPLQLHWDASSLDGSSLDVLPFMTTDIHLQADNRRIIIDTKYYKETMQAFHGKQTVHSGNLYQLFAYLKNSEALGPEYLKSEGILLYPTVGRSLHFRASFQGHPITVCTINLDQPWTSIRTDLLSLLQFEGAA